MRVTNNSYKNKFFNIELLRFVDPLELGFKWSDFDNASLDSHTKNCLRMSQRPDTYLPVLKNVVPVPPRSVWEISSIEARQVNRPTFSTKNTKSINDFQKITQRLINLVKGNLAVELSGGLDTAIVIGLLRSIGVNPALIGAISDRYEFRTERFIQEKIASEAKNVHLINEADALPFTNLMETPVHPIPNKASLFYYLNDVTAKWAVENSHRYVLNGIGFDSILIDKISEPTNAYFFDPINLDDGWANDYVFTRHGVHYVNVASLHCVLKTLITVRSGQSEDVKKLWARDVFKQVIPTELSNYQYKASFGAVYDQGLEKAHEDIMEMCNLVYDLSGLKELNPSKMAVLFNGVRSYDHKAEFAFLARMSYVNWVYQLHRSNLISER